MIMAAGLGTRMQTLTNSLPKPLLRIGKFTLLEIALRKLKNSGIRRVAINVHYKKEEIKSYLAQQPVEGLDIFISEEETLMGTGGGIAKAEPFFQGETILVLNPDVLCDISIARFTRFHFASGAIASMALLPSRDFRNYGLVIYTQQNRIESFQLRNQPIPPGALSGIFTGYQILSPDARSYLVARASSIISSFYLKALYDRQPIAAYLHDGEWVDVGTKPQYSDTILLHENGQFNPERYFTAPG